MVFFDTQNLRNLNRHLTFDGLLMFACVFLLTIFPSLHAANQKMLSLLFYIEQSCFSKRSSFELVSRYWGGMAWAWINEQWMDGSMNPTIDEHGWLVDGW